MRKALLLSLAFALACQGQLFGPKNASRLQGRDICDTAPTAGQGLVWSDGLVCWTPGTAGGGDNLGTATAPDIVALFTGSGDYLKTDGTRGTPEPAITILNLSKGGTGQNSWTASRCVQVAADGKTLESAAAACGTGGGLANVVEDTTPQLGGALDLNSQNITTPAGAISPTVFGYLFGVTSAIQTQFAGKAATSGTPDTTFQIDNDNAGPLWKHEGAGVMSCRNATDSAYCALKVDSVETTGTGDWTLTDQTARSAPAAGTTIWTDSTTKTLRAINTDGTTSTTAVAKAAVSNQFFTAMSAGGAFTAAQPAFTDISGTATAAQLPSTAKVRGFGGSWGDGVATLTAGGTYYRRIPFACTITAWSVTVDAGTATVDIWKVASGTAAPVVGDSIGTIAIASNTHVLDDTPAGELTTLAVSANDVVGLNLNAVDTAKAVSADITCSQ